MHNLAGAFSAIGSGSSIASIFIGALIGMVFGVIPGLSAAVLLSIMLVLSYHLDLITTLCLFLGTQAGSYYSASITSILLNTPAHPEAFPVALDGFPMARRGEPGRALGISAASTFVGGLIGCVVLLAFVPLFNDLPNLMHPPEYVGLVSLALALVATLGAQSSSKAIASIGIGLSISAIGGSNITGVFRYAFGAPQLFSGVSLVALALGMFAIPQMVMVFATGTAFAQQDLTGRELDTFQPVQLPRRFGGQVIRGIFETVRNVRLLVQSAVIGAVTGIIPGIGGFAANYLTYGVARQLSRRRAEFGTGVSDGILAPEASSLAKEAGSLIPIFSLGIPGTVAGALFLGALTVKNIRPGYGFTTAYPLLAPEAALIMAISGLIGTTAGVLLSPRLARLTLVPGPILFPFIIAFSVVGPYIADINFFSVVEVLVFGVVGLVMRRLGYSLASAMLGLVLGSVFETNIYLTHTVYRGASFLVDRPVADIMGLLVVVVLVSSGWRGRRQRSAKAASEVSDTGQVDGPSAERARYSPYPVLALATSAGLLALSIWFVAYAAVNYNLRTALLPEISGSLVVLSSGWMLPRDVVRYLNYRRDKSERSTTSAVSFEKQEVLSQSGPTNPTDAATKSRRSFGDIRSRSWGRYGQYSRELAAFAWVIGLVVACYLFGFVWSVPVFVGLYSVTCLKRYITTFRMLGLFTTVACAAMWGAVFELFNFTHVVFTPVVNL